MEIPESVLRDSRVKDTQHKFVYAIVVGLYGADGDLSLDAIAKIGWYTGLKPKRVACSLMRLAALGLVKYTGGSVKMGVGQNPAAKDKQAFAQKMRDNPTPTENMMAGLLDEKFYGLFKSQVVILGYIADFYSNASRLVVEVDGSIHSTPKQVEYDRHRDEAMRNRGIKVVRIPSQMLKTAEGRAEAESRIRQNLKRTAKPTKTRKARQDSHILRDKLMAAYEAGERFVSGQR